MLRNCGKTIAFPNKRNSLFLFTFQPSEYSVGSCSHLATTRNRDIHPDAFEPINQSKNQLTFRFVICLKYFSTYFPIFSLFLCIFVCLFSPLVAKHIPDTMFTRFTWFREPNIFLKPRTQSSSTKKNSYGSLKEKNTKGKISLRIHLFHVL